jgi:hypothetical protein
LRPIKRLKVRRPARLNGDERFSDEIFRNYGRGETRPLITQSRKDSRYIGQRFGDCKVFVQVRCDGGGCDAASAGDQKAS